MDILLSILFVALLVAAGAGLVRAARHDRFATHARPRYFD